MMVYQMHEDHGRHISYSSLEANENIKNGWETVSKEEFYAQGEAIGQKRDVPAPKEEGKKGKKKGK